MSQAALSCVPKMLSVRVNPTQHWGNAMSATKLPATKSIIAAIIALAGMPLAMPAPAQAQNWPTRPVKFIVPFGPGAGADIGGRLFAEKLSQKWGQPVVIENKPGGDSIVAIQAFLTANDDHVLFFGPSGNFTVHPFNYTKLTYNPGRHDPGRARVHHA